MTAVKPTRVDAIEAPPDDLNQRAQAIREASDFESMRGLLGELPPGIFPPRSEGFFWRRRREN